MKNLQEKICLKCGMPKLKAWKDLSGEQKFLIERLPLSAEFSHENRKTHLFCVNCWNEVYSETTNHC